MKESQILTQIDALIHIEGARTHNLQNVSLDIPIGQFTVLTGPSGSGKSSLAFDTLFAAGQRQYLETLSLNTQELLCRIPHPDVDSIIGLPPTVAIDQRSRTPTNRSTVGTLTEVYDYLRLLYARCGLVYCFQCGQAIEQQTVSQILNRILELPDGTKMMLLAPLTRNESDSEKIAALFGHLVKVGFMRCRFDGEIVDLETIPNFNKTQPHCVEAVVDRLIIKDGVRERLSESLQLTLKESGGSATAAFFDNEQNVWQDIAFSTLYACPQCRIEYRELEPRTFSFNSPYGACPVCNGTGISDDAICSDCGGSRLRKESRSVTVTGKRIDEICALPLDETFAFFQTLKLPDEKQQIAKTILEQLLPRLQFLNNIGVSYLTLNRSGDTLSGGEYQRVRLASALGSGLTGACYVLDEPSIGLHPKDNQRLIECLKTLQQQGNTVLVVEHDESMIAAADEVVEFGHGAGKYGGQIVFQGTAEKWMSNNNVASGLTQRASVGAVNSASTKLKGSKNITLRNVNTNNLKNVTVSFPLGQLTVVSGVSGSGKSSLVNQTLVPAVRNYLQPSKNRRDDPHFEMTGDILDKLIVVDQSPLGRSGRSNPATYSGMFDEIRSLFAKSREAKRRGFNASRFSFNTSGGRCEHCKGTGMWSTHDCSVGVFSPDILQLEVPCPECNGKRFKPQTLAIWYKGKSIADVLDMSIDEASIFFENIPPIYRYLEMMQEIGLGYLALGQPASTLSGGESQRVKLASELAKTETEKTLYILDEPTTGLYKTDVERLLNVLIGLAQRGNTVIVIEHHPAVICRADYLIELGPEGGKNGGFIKQI